MRIEVQKRHVYLTIAFLIVTVLLSQVSRVQAAVRMSSFTATSDSDLESTAFVRLDWITQTEESSSFLIQRVEENDTFTEPSGNIQDYVNGDDIISIQYKGTVLEEIASLGGPTSGAVYTANDRNVEIGKTYRYRIVEIDLSGILVPIADSNYIPTVAVIDPDANSGSAIGGGTAPEATIETPTVEATVTEEVTVTVEVTSASEEATEAPEVTETPTQTPTVEPDVTEEAAETTSDATETPEPTNTPEPTETPEPTNTPEPTATQTPVAGNTPAPAATLVIVPTSTPRVEDANEDSAESDESTPPTNAVVEERTADPEESSDTTGSTTSVAVTNENEEKAVAQAIVGVAVAEAADSDEAYPIESQRVEEASVEETVVVEVETASGEAYPVSAEIDTNNNAALSAVTEDDGNLIVFPTIEPIAAASGNSINAGSNASQIGGTSGSGDVIGGDGGQLAPPVQTGDTSSNSDSGGNSILLWVVFGAGILVFIAGIIGSILIFTRQRED